MIKQLWTMQHANHQESLITILRDVSSVQIFYLIKMLRQAGCTIAKFN